MGWYPTALGIRPSRPGEALEGRPGELPAGTLVGLGGDPGPPRKVKEGKGEKSRGEEKPKAAREPAGEPAKPAPPEPAPPEKSEPPPRAAEPEKETQAEPEEPPQPAAQPTDERPPLRPRSRGKRMKGRPEKPSLEKVRGPEAQPEEPPETEAKPKPPPAADRRERRREPAPRSRSRKREREEPKPIEQRLEKAQGEKAEAALESTEWLLDLVDMDVDGAVYEGDDRIEIELRGPDRKYLVADDGKVLSALEHLVPRVMHGVCGEALPVRVDSENFQELREDRLRGLAWETADEVRREGQASILNAMDPADRRIVHLALSDDPEVTTRSLGDGFFKRIKVLLK